MAQDMRDATPEEIANGKKWKRQIDALGIDRVRDLARAQYARLEPLFRGPLLQPEAVSHQDEFNALTQLLSRAEEASSARELRQYYGAVYLGLRFVAHRMGRDELIVELPEQGKRQGTANGLILLGSALILAALFGGSGKR